MRARVRAVRFALFVHGAVSVCSVLHVVPGDVLLAVLEKTVRVLRVLYGYSGFLSVFHVVCVVVMSFSWFSKNLRV